jgi:protein TonB
MQGVLAPPVGETTPIPILATTVFLPPPVPPNVTGPATAALSSARLIHRVEPVYPKLALSSRVQGPVVLKATILRSGRLSKIQVVSGNALLVGAAVNAVQQWRYKPVELDGKPVDTETTVTVNFSLGAR